MLSVTISGTEYEVDASPAEVAGLGATRAREMSKLTPGEGQTEETPLLERPGYIAADESYLEHVVQHWADAQSPAPSEADVNACLERALASYAGQPAPEPVVEPLTPEAEIARLLAYAADKRWQREIAGTVWNGHGVHTDRESQTKLLAAFVQLGAGMRTDPDVWKLKDGYWSLTNAQMSEVITAALTHVQTAFAIESVIEAHIKDGSITTTAEIDAAFA